MFISSSTVVIAWLDDTDYRQLQIQRKVFETMAWRSCTFLLYATETELELQTAIQLQKSSMLELQSATRNYRRRGLAFHTADEVWL
jgi:hypothetical protein